VVKRDLPKSNGAAVQERASAQLVRLIGIMRRLRAPGGCDWDRAQTLLSLRPYLIEECYEVLEALESGSSTEHCEELGDLLFQIVFQAQIADESGEWDLADVIEAIADKLESRHPQIFGGELPDSVTSETSPEDRWARIKAVEKEKKRGERVSVIDGVPRDAPALLRAERITEKASRIGFDWPDVEGVRAKVNEELGELDEAIRSGDPAAIEHELGDVFLTLTNLARHLQTPAEDSLRQAIRRFERRFLWLEEKLHENGKPTGGVATAEELESLWVQAKERV